MTWENACDVDFKSRKNTVKDKENMQNYYRLYLDYEIISNIFHFILYTFIFHIFYNKQVLLL